MVSIIVESYRPDVAEGAAPIVLIRPVQGQPFPVTMDVRCSNRLSDAALHDVGTRFRIKVKPTKREDGSTYLSTPRYSHPYEVL
ncbi:hypothetical protein LGH83_00060 [Lichenihabitans sp. PAMC28606]|uniref:hypothetical protein n=1 Tax=Lichenihabitans sp. PAMC28606 TaxID=2880932 RepID=UPI001D0AE32E|nr:hypothetical protein [Lichenihabitans sp. PAMC28606]UDL94726.1 hypothetical protein LGH83_00060 [Lichenihabitans sp. PAMC28606]